MNVIMMSLHVNMCLHSYEYPCLCGNYVLRVCCDCDCICMCISGCAVLYGVLICCMCMCVCMCVIMLCLQTVSVLYLKL